MITLTNPHDGTKHEMDADAFAELRQAYDQAIEAERDELVFRAMRLDIATAREILAADV